MSNTGNESGAMDGSSVSSKARYLSPNSLSSCWAEYIVPMLESAAPERAIEPLARIADVRLELSLQAIALC